MIISSWNIRSMNSPGKIKEVRNFLEVNKVSIIGLVETKIKEHKAVNVQKQLGNMWNWSTNYSHHRNGRVWVGWRNDKCKVHICGSHRQYIATKVTPLENQDAFFVVFVYGMHSVSDRKELWQELRKFDRDTPFLFIGDFNAVYKEDHGKNGTLVTTYETHDMQKWMEDMELHPIAELGHKYSWSNKEEGENRILTKIDHAIGNVQWMDLYSQAHVCYANAQTSDHTPLIVTLSRYVHQGKKSFRFFNYMCEHQNFVQVVSKAWKIKTKDTGLQSIWYKLKNVKNQLKNYTPRSLLESKRELSIGEKGSQTFKLIF